MTNKDTCPYCGAELEEDATFCPECEIEIEPLSSYEEPIESETPKTKHIRNKFCNNCGRLMDENSNICPVCRFVHTP